MNNTPIQIISEDLNDNTFYMKREDLLGFSFGGNKARKAINFFNEIDNNGYDAVVTYGSSSSNHCRIISNMAASRNISCYIISPEETSEETFNKKMMKLFGAQIITVPVSEVHNTIEKQLDELRQIGKKPYFIPGGGHGNLGTQAYVDAYNEIKQYEKENNIKFDYIFFASGTGTTQAGLVCGQIQNKDFDRKIIGISIARKKERGQKIIIDSIKEYLNTEIDDYLNYIEFNDDYILDGYNEHNDNILDIIKRVLFNDGVALNSTYTGKAYYGMLEYIKKNNIKNKSILFINTGGLPLFFDDMEELVK